MESVPEDLKPWNLLDAKKVVGDLVSGVIRERNPNYDAPPTPTWQSAAYGIVTHLIPGADEFLSDQLRLRTVDTRSGAVESVAGLWMNRVADRQLSEQRLKDLLLDALCVFGPQVPDDADAIVRLWNPNPGRSPSVAEMRELARMDGALGAAVRAYFADRLDAARKADEKKIAELGVEAELRRRRPRA